MAGGRGFDVLAPSEPQPVLPVQPTFLISGRERASGKDVCYTVYADSPDAAKAIAADPDVEVPRIDMTGPLAAPAS